MSFSITEHITKVLIDGLVATAITCPVTGEVLDAKTCVTIIRADGTPVAVLSQAGYLERKDDPRFASSLASAGLSVNPDTVRDATPVGA